MTLDTAIGYFRSRELDLFRSECVITRATAAPTFDPDADTITQDADEVYAGPCNVRPVGGSGRDVDAAQDQIRIELWQGKLPVDTAVAIDDLLAVTVSRFDAGLVGKTFRVTDVQFDDYQITRRVALELVTGLPTPNVDDEPVGS